MFTDTSQFKQNFKEKFIEKLQTMQGKGIEDASLNDKYLALASVIRDEISKKWIRTNRQYRQNKVKQVYYFSIEFMLGKLLGMNLINCGVREFCRDVLADLGIELEQLENEEPEAGLGNGGLGRLAACFLDSVAALNLPGHGCGIRYKYGLFEQKIVNNHQVELPDNWLKDGYVWEYKKADKAVKVNFWGQVRTVTTADGRLSYEHINYQSVLAVPYDIPIVGYKNNTVNTLRLWSAEPVESEFDLSSFNHGDYLKIIEYKHAVERISKILYPDDTMYEGRLLRLKQEYFFVAAGIKSIIRYFKDGGENIVNLPDKVAIHINDTHPALAIPELMRILMDEEGLGWDEAWRITTSTISYTNHTVMPEALETWPVDMFESLLPRIYMIVCEINRRLCQKIESMGNGYNLRDMAIIVDNTIHMARLAVVGSYSVNGVAALHTDILKNHLMHNFHSFYPGKFNNKTNGIAHRRWLIKANPKLAKLITDTIWHSWVAYPCDLIKLMRYAEDSSFQQKIAEIKLSNKQLLAKYIKEKYGTVIDVNSVFDVQVKRIHAYKRQILNALHIMHLYNALRENPGLDIVPRTFIFAGKAAPGYYIAKQTIKLINLLARLINNDRQVSDKLKVVFLENYNVSLAEMVIPAADVSEQISTASKEASGTGNMKFMMNGAITIGTLDGANIEISETVGRENIVIFGLTAEEVMNYYRQGGYNAWEVYHGDIRVRTVLEQLVNGFFPNEKEEFRPLYDSLLHHNDEFFVLKDFAAYADAHRELEERYNDRPRWLKMSISNIAYSGYFSSDRTITEYANGIWKIKPLIVL